MTEREAATLLSHCFCSLSLYFRGGGEEKEEKAGKIVGNIEIIQPLSLSLSGDKTARAKAVSTILLKYIYIYIYTR